MRNPPLRLALGGGLALALAGAAVVAVAQTPAPAPATEVERDVLVHRQGPDGPHRFGFGGAPDREALRRPMARRAPEDRAERLRVLLQLTPAQDAALKAYVAATAPPAPEAFVQRSTDDRTPPTAVERADRAADAAGRIAAEARKRADATRAFYAALTPSQRKVFDTAPGAGGGPRILEIRHLRGEGPPRPPQPPAPPPQPGRPG